MNEAITNAVWLWLVQSTLLFILLSGLLLTSHKLLLKYIGAQSTYSLWALLPLALVIPMLVPVLSPLYQSWLGNWTEPSFMAPVQQFYADQQGVSERMAGHSSFAFWSMAVTVVWASVCIALTIAFFVRVASMKNMSRNRFKGLYCLEHDAGSSPGISGFWHPTLHLPKDFKERFSTREQRLIVQHELGHWRRGDLQVNLLAWLVLACQWFNPLAWAAYRRFRADQELACDAYVLNRATKRNTASPIATVNSLQVCYANALLAAMQSVSHPAQSRSLLSDAACTHYGNKQGAKHMAQERLNQLTSIQPSRRWPLAVSAGALTCAGLIALAPAAAHNHDTQPAFENEVQASAQQPVVHVQPRYPQYAVDQKLEGWVDLSFVITPGGTVDQVEVIDALPSGVFNEVAIEALSKWRYLPQENLPQTIRLQFSLSDDS